MSSEYTLPERLRTAIGPANVLTQPEDLKVYSFDAYSEAQAPCAVALPRSTEDAAQVVRIAREFNQPVVARGAGTGLCGGAVAAQGGVVVSFARMNGILAIDRARRRATVQPGLINLDLSRAAEKFGLFYAPDPSSQKICTIGGNVATNAGGPHCLAYGTTTNHVLALQIVDSGGNIAEVSLDQPGYDLTGLLVGSEGTLALVCGITVRLKKLPEAVRVYVSAFGDVEGASQTVSAIIAAGIVPCALEIMDAIIVKAVEAAFSAGYPLDAGAVLLVEVAGSREDVEVQENTIARIAREHGATSWRAASSLAEREALWAGRKGAAGATGRIAPNYYIQDACVPRSRLPEALRQVSKSAARAKLPVGNVFHAGDGNLHPLMMYDRRIPRDVEAVVAAGDEILAACIELGGTISGEHGIGYEKRDAMTRCFNADDLRAMTDVRDVFDSEQRLNPGKIFPDARCAEVQPLGLEPG